MMCAKKQLTLQFHDLHAFAILAASNKKQSFLLEMLDVFRIHLYPKQQQAWTLLLWLRHGRQGKS